VKEGRNRDEEAWRAGYRLAARVYETAEGGRLPFEPISYPRMMWSLRFLAGTLALGMVALTAAGAGCSMLSNADGEAPESERDVAAVDSLHAPAQIATSDTLSLRLTGTVGPNGCYAFDGFDVERAAGQLTLTPVVLQRDADMCTQAIVPLDETYAAAPPFAEGTLTVVVPQPDRPDVTATIDVTTDAE